MTTGTSGPDTIHLTAARCLFPRPTAWSRDRHRKRTSNGRSIPHVAATTVPAQVRVRIESGALLRPCVSTLLDGRRPDSADTICLADDALRALPLPGSGSHQRLPPDGLIAGSERGERFLFWPMGIASAGAMHASGAVHATLLSAGGISRRCGFAGAALRCCRADRTGDNRGPHH